MIYNDIQCYKWDIQWYHILIQEFNVLVKDNINIREIIEKNKLQDIIEYIKDTNRLNRKTEDWINTW